MHLFLIAVKPTSVFYFVQRQGLEQRVHQTNGNACAHFPILFLRLNTRSLTYCTIGATAITMTKLGTTVGRFPQGLVVTLKEKRKAEGKSTFRSFSLHECIILHIHTPRQTYRFFTVGLVFWDNVLGGRWTT